MVKTWMLGVAGFVLVAAGVTFVFRDWLFVQMVFRGVIGPLMAVAGLVVMSFLKR